MKLNFMIIDTYYPSFLDSFYKEHPDINTLSYTKHLNILLNECFGTSDSYSHNLKLLGHNAIDIIANDKILQSKWSKEHRINFSENKMLERLQNAPLLHRYFGRPGWSQELILEQVKHTSPDIVYVHDLSF